MFPVVLLVVVVLVDVVLLVDVVVLVVVVMVQHVSHDDPATVKALATW